MASKTERPEIMIIEPGASDAQAIIRAGNVTIDLHKVQDGIDNRRNDDLSWAHFTKAIEAGLSIDGHSATWRQLSEIIIDDWSNAIRDRVDSKITNKIRNGMPVSGLVERLDRRLHLDHEFKLFYDALRAAEANSIAKGTEICANANAVSVAKQNIGDGFDAASISSKKHAINTWKSLIFDEVIPLAREKEPELYNAERTDAQVWAMLVNSVCTPRHSKDSKFGELAFENEDKEMLWDMLPVDRFSEVLAAHVGFEGSTLEKKLSFCEKIAIHGLEMDREGVPDVVANARDRAFEAAEKETPSTRAMKEGATFVLSGPALNPGGPPSVHEQAHGEGRAVEMGEDRYGAILDIIGKARRQKGWKHLTDPVHDDSPPKGHSVNI